MTCPPTGRLTLAVASSMIIAACSSTSPPLAEPSGAPRAELDAAALRAEGPAGLARALAAFDRATGAERERLAGVVDQVAAQRYASVSRLYWYTDLDAARAAARASGRPILSLRMLGRLDEDLSCANSRFFRVALYANAALSSWLRDHVVLHWSSERPVPKVTIDFGDGRSIATTVAGNSAHYVLDADGQVIDVIPGLMTPRAFRAELEAALAIEGELAVHHLSAGMALAGLWQQIAADGVPELTWGEALADAEPRAITKMMAEAPIVRRAVLGERPTSLAADSRAWEQIGVRALAARGLETAPVEGDQVAEPPRVLDAQSRALIERLGLFDWARPGEALAPADRERRIRAFEAAIVADTGLALRLREQIHRELGSRASRGASRDLESVNAWVYSSLFLTPAGDRWLGMATPGVFTGLPGDGVRYGRN